MSESSKLIGDVKVRYDWYQTENEIVLNVLFKNIDASKLKIDCKAQSIAIALPDLDTPLELNLSHEVKHESVSHKVTPVKLEVKLPKLEGFHWGKLEGEDPIIGKAIPKPETSASSQQGKNWDAVVKDLVEDDEDPLNSLFKKIYSEGSDEVKKAMAKSFSESNGTVLSTNWNEVGAEKVTCKPPDGTELRKWH